MDTSTHNLQSLFAQLGLDSSDKGINQFIGQNRPLAADLHIGDAKMWSPAQAALLKEGLANDADWAEAIDELSTRLRA